MAGAAPEPGAPDLGVPTVVLRAVDGDQNAGVSRIEYALDGSPAFQEYREPFSIPPGTHTVDYWARDASGRVAAARRIVLPVDTTPPRVAATMPVPAIWVRPLVPSAQLCWTLSDDLSKTAEVDVVVYDALGFEVRRIDGGTVGVNPLPTAGCTAWDGSIQRVVGQDQDALTEAPPGVYFFRVVATDEAGNAAQSGESTPLQLVPLL